MNYLIPELKSKRKNAEVACIITTSAIDKHQFRLNDYQITHHPKLLFRQWCLLSTQQALMAV